MLRLSVVSVVSSTGVDTRTHAAFACVARTLCWVTTPTTSLDSERHASTRQQTLLEAPASSAVN